MSGGVALRLGFDDGPIRAHLAKLAILDRQGFEGVRREIGEMVLGDVQDNFDDQRLADGSPMPQSKAAIARQGKTLIDNRNPGLYSSYIYQLAGNHGVEIGSDSAYARIHHFGGETGRKGHRFTLPARPVLGMGPAQEQAIGDFLIAEITRAQRA